MDVRERRWLYVLIGVFLLVNIITLSPLVPWQKWLLWGDPTPQKSFDVEFEDYQIRLPAGGMRGQGRRVCRVHGDLPDVTYGLGVFRQDGTMVFQMQVLPGHENRIVWKFDAAGSLRRALHRILWTAALQDVCPGRDPRDSMRRQR